MKLVYKITKSENGDYSLNKECGYIYEFNDQEIEYLGLKGNKNKKYYVASSPIPDEFYNKTYTHMLDMIIKLCYEENEFCSLHETVNEALYYTSFYMMNCKYKYLVNRISQITKDAIRYSIGGTCVISNDKPQIHFDLVKTNNRDKIGRL